MDCPTCHFTSQAFIELATSQFHETLYKCTNCDTILVEVHGKYEVVQDAQEHSFLESITEPVESDDY